MSAIVFGGDEAKAVLARDKALRHQTEEAAGSSVEHDDGVSVSIKPDGSISFSHPTGLPASLLRSLGLSSTADVIEANKKASPQAGD